MKKKVNIFGKTVPVFVLVLLGVGLVSAALVPYLSGLVIGTVNVKQPLSIIPVSANLNEETIPIIDIEGGYKYDILELVAGSKLTTYSYLKNNADFIVNNVMLEIHCTNSVNDIEGGEITVTYTDYYQENGDVHWSGHPEIVLKDGEVYFYITGGDSINGYAIVANYNSDAPAHNDMVELEFALNTKPDTYTCETRIIQAENKVLI